MFLCGPFDRLRDPCVSSGLKEGDNDYCGKHQADHRGIDEGDNLEGFAVSIVVKAEGLEHGREAVAHVEPNDDEENQVGDGDVRNLELRPGLLVEIQVAVNPAEFDEVEIREMRDKAYQEQDACPDLQFRACVRLGALGFVVAFWSRHLVGDGQPDGQDDVEQQGTEQHDLEGFHDIVGAHEVAEGVVPCAAVVT